MTFYAFPAFNDLSLIRENLEYQNLSSSTKEIIMASWRKGTQKQYKSYLFRWEDYCNREQISPDNPGLSKALEFLRELFESGVGYSGINTARSFGLSFSQGCIRIEA